MSRRRSSWAVVFATLVFGPGPPASAAQPVALETVRELVLAPLVQIGQSPEAMVERLGDARSSEVQALLDSAGQPSGVLLQLIKGDGWEAEICKSLSVFNLSTFRVSRSHSSLRLPISPGGTRESVEGILGPPFAEAREGLMAYRYPPSYPEYHLAIVEVRDGRVTGIEWVFGLEDKDPCKRARAELP